MAANDKCSVENVEKKLMTMNSSQDSVQAMSLWIMHNRSHHQRIVDTWLKVLKKSETKHKLTLFYLCNDVVQHAKRKKALYYLENFKDNLREAVMSVRDADKIRHNIERVFNIWEQRRTYDVKFILELRRILSGDIGGFSSKDSSAKSTPVSAVSPVPKMKKKKDKKEKREPDISIKISPKEEVEEEEVEDESNEEEKEEIIEEMEEFKPSKFIEEVTTLRQIETEVTMKAKQLTMMRIDATNVDAVKQLKDRSHGADFCKQFEESCIKIEDYVTLLGREIRERKIVVAHCDQAEGFYEEQFKEAKIVANAYKNYGARITNMKKRVDDMKKIIPATPSPVPSPTADAPSPGNTPVLPEMDDNDMVDMDLCEEDQEEARKLKASDSVPPGRAYTAMVKSIPQPIPSLTNITIGQKENDPVEKEESLSPKVDKPEEQTSSFQGSNILESRIANMLPNLAKGNSNLGLNMPTAPVRPVEVYSPPPKTEEPEPSDDRASTPVQDEQEEKTQTPVKVSQPPVTKSTSSTKVKTNPIDFLSQLLTKTSSSSSSSNFLHSLSLLTNTVKGQYQKKEQVNEELNTPDNNIPSNTPGSEAPVSYTGVPAPEPVTQSSSWPEWKNTSAPAIGKPPLPPDSESPSPPVLASGQPPKFPPPQPPLPQHPPPPLNIPPPQPYPVQPPSPQDFSMPPPVSQTFPRTPVSQSFLTPPPLSQSFNQRPPPPPPPHNAAINPPAPLPVNPISPTQLPPQRTQFSHGFPFGIPPVPNSNTPTSVAPPQNPRPYPPPPPPQSAAPPPPPWQQENLPGTNQEPVSSFNNRIATVPSLRSEWNPAKDTEYNPDEGWEEKEEETNGQESRYAHPWDQPQNYEEEEEEEEEESDNVIIPTRPVVTPPKSILRNNRSSSLREVTLVDDNESNSDTVNSNNTHNAPPDIAPVGILKKPPTDIKPLDHIGDVQTEFIAKLKQKSGGNSVPAGPPNSRTLTTVQMEDSFRQDSISTGHSEQQISTIGVLGGGSRADSVKSDDMDIDNGEDEGNIEVHEENEWVDTSEMEEWQEERQGYISREFETNIPAQIQDRGPPRLPVHHHLVHEEEPPPRPRFEEHVRPPVSPVHPLPPDVPGMRIPRFEEHVRAPPPRPHVYEHPPYPPAGNFRHPHQFQDQFRGPPPAKRPFYPSPGLRMPYYRY